jgi:hypothetical protein
MKRNIIIVLIIIFFFAACGLNTFESDSAPMLLEPLGFAGITDVVITAKAERGPLEQIAVRSGMVRAVWMELGFKTHGTISCDARRKSC